jgi:hypothetical protein
MLPLRETLLPIVAVSIVTPAICAIKLATRLETISTTTT